MHRWNKQEPYIPIGTRRSRTLNAATSCTQWDVMLQDAGIAPTVNGRILLG